MTVLDARQKRALAAELLRRRDQRARPIPLSAAQHRLWLLHELEPGVATYNIPYAFTLRGPLDIEALRRAFATIVRRHDVLRSTIVVCDGEPAYVVDDGSGFALPLLDAAAGACVEIVARESARPFDLRSDAPLRVLLLRVAADEHVLVVTLHHIAADGWSAGVLKRELGALYAAYRSAGAAPLAETACTYADFARRQRDDYAGSAFAERIGYWHARLDAPPRALDFGPPRDTIASPAAGALRTRILGPAERAALERVGRAHGTTLFATLLGAFALLLARFTGQRDFIVGSAFANRMRPEFEELIGFFVNVLPLRLALANDPTLDEWLAQIQRLAIDAFDRQDVPFDALVATARPARVATQVPLVNVMFVLNNVPDEPLELEALEVVARDIERTSAKFDLTLEATFAGGDLRLGFEYRTDRFDAGTIDAMLDALVTLVVAFDGTGSRRVSALPLLSPAARSRAVDDWNATARPLARERIERLFERRAAEAPAAIALVDGPFRLTYGELDGQANRLAHYLRAAGTDRDSRVGVLFERGAAAVVSMLAILKAGGAYVPLDPAYPRLRLEAALSAAGVTRVFTEERWAGALAGGAVEVFRLDADAGQLAAYAATAPAPLPGADGGDPAYVMSTSGSSGTPKAVIIAHTGIERLAVQPDYAPIGAADTVGHGAPLAFDAATFEIWAPLLNGARIAVLARDTLLDPAALRTAFERDRITIVFLTTPLAREIARTAPATFAPLHRLLVGGEALDAATVRAIMRAAPHTRLCNIYGPTETTTFATWHPFVTEPAAEPIPIGRPIVNTRAYVLDALLTPQPPGAAGELYIGGPGVALGYLDDPAETAARFIRDPFSDEPSARLYATGDRARYRADGAIEFLGRSDDQIKRRGYRIEPGEIEAALRALPAVGGAAVVAHGAAGETIRLVAYVTPADGCAIDTPALIDALRARLPEHLLPDAIEPIPTLPLTVNGKVDRADLAARLPSARAVTGARLRNEAEAAVAAIWEQLLATGPVAHDDNFFALGGHSLLALRMLAQIERTHAVSLPPALLFAEPTVARLARAMCEHSLRAEHSPTVAFNTGGAAQPFFFLHGSIGGGGFYCRTFAERIGAQRPVYAIRPHAKTRRTLPSFAAMAVDTVNEIKRLQPHGPYVLGGYCNGGLVAFEAARRLRAGGDAVANVILVDVPPVSRAMRRIAGVIDRAGIRLRLPKPLRDGTIAFTARLPHHSARFIASRDKVRHVARGVAKLLCRARPAMALRRIDGGTEKTILDPWIALTETYVAQQYDGRLTLLRTRDDDAGGGWLEVAPQTAVHVIPGTHVTCITDCLNETAVVLAEILTAEP
jgi:amino acid adenylation domain-containing protein